MNIFMIEHVVQKCDTDGWDHWEEYLPVSYHSTLENAQTEQKKLIEKWATVEFEQYKAFNSHLPEKYFVEELKRRLSNEKIIGIGTSGDSETFDCYRIQSLELKD